MEKIDILMATYNGKECVGKQIESILNQTHKEFNLVILDDYSQDNTYDILQEYEKKDKRIKVYRNEKNMGSNKTFERLLSYVTSDYFMFSDQDDIWFEDKVESTFNFLKANDKDLVYTDLSVYLKKDDELIKVADSFNSLKKIRHKQLKYTDYRLEYLYNVVTGCTILCKSEYIKEFVPFVDNKDLIHDAWIGLVMSIKGNVGYLDKPTMKYIQHGKNQVGTSRYIDKLDNFEDVRNHLINVKLSRLNSMLENIDKLRTDKIDIEHLTNEAIIYFNHLKDVKNINFKYINTFNKLYKWEKLSYKLIQYVTFNIPCLAKVIYNFRKRK